eukprot:355792-Chlamydomonas_euryale.AAC.5
MQHVARSALADTGGVGDIQGGGEEGGRTGGRWKRARGRGEAAEPRFLPGPNATSAVPHRNCITRGSLPPCRQRHSASHARGPVRGTAPAAPPARRPPPSEGSVETVSAPNNRLPYLRVAPARRSVVPASSGGRRGSGDDGGAPAPLSRGQDSLQTWAKVGGVIDREVATTSSLHGPWSQLFEAEGRGGPRRPPQARGHTPAGAAPATNSPSRLSACPPPPQSRPATVFSRPTSSAREHPSIMCETSSKTAITGSWFDS